ncbi:MAG TPA: hypothetical protein VM756_13205 [Burkholderiales bacterium]|nr:hypothetical protein [Burkholderiales bacterium]
MGRLILLTGALLCGCAGTEDCGPDWRAVGQRDGRMNYGHQIERYAARCGTPVDRAAYETGYSEGFADRPRPAAL